MDTFYTVLKMKIYISVEVFLNVFFFIKDQVLNKKELSFILCDCMPV